MIEIGTHKLIIHEDPREKRIASLEELQALVNDLVKAAEEAVAGIEKAKQLADEI